MSKISPQFAARLARIKPKQKLQAVVMLAVPQAAGKAAGRTTPEDRQRVLSELADGAGPVLQEIDDVLDRFGGRRLSDRPTAVGTIAVETTPAGIAALADSEHVKLILENQPVLQVR